MTAPEKNYTTALISDRLKETMYGAVATHDGDEIHGRHMVFACRDDLQRVYMLTHGATRKVQELRAEPRATLIVHNAADSTEEVSQCSLVGQFRILAEFEDDAVQDGLQLLAQKTPIVRGMIAGGSLGEYVVLELMVSWLEFRVYEDILADVPPTIMRFTP